MPSAESEPGESRSPYRAADAPPASAEPVTRPHANRTGDRVMLAVVAALVAVALALAGGVAVAVLGMAEAHWAGRRDSLERELSPVLEAPAVRALIAANDPAAEPPLPLEDAPTAFRGTIGIHAIARLGGVRLGPEARGAIVTAGESSRVHIAHARLPDARIARTLEELAWLAVVRPEEIPRTAGAPSRFDVVIVDVGSGRPWARAAVMAEGEVAMAFVAELVEAALDQ